MEGKVKLPSLKKTLLLLNELLDPLGGQRSKTFRTQIRSYNANLNVIRLEEYMLAISQCHDYEPIKVNESSNKPISPIKFLMDKAFCHNNQSGPACFS